MGTALEFSDTCDSLREPASPHIGSTMRQHSKGSFTNELLANMVFSISQMLTSRSGVKRVPVPSTSVL